MNVCTENYHYNIMFLLISSSVATLKYRLGILVIYYNKKQIHANNFSHFHTLEMAV
jgi:hypothetical protein